ncbi:hypothetical protein OBV_p-00490 (plasmid) [Oscillibacter valericigenes Sjm18-20]|nr:hypothetical protein OBV_p-00490 [Oscillibacter valericigenes Sjm18-20]
MSLNVGTEMSKYVVVNNVTMRFAFSEKVLFADLRTSRKTGKQRVDKASGEVLTDSHGNPIPERTYSHWEGRFVGNAFEPAKALCNGQSIDITQGWVEKDEATGKGGQKYTNVYVIITDFVLSETDCALEQEAPTMTDLAEGNVPFTATNGETENESGERD